MRCPDCNKFASIEESEPEVTDESPMLDNGTVEIDVRIVNTCQECGTELTTAEFNTSITFDEEILEQHEGEGHELSVSIDNAGRTQTRGKGGRRAPVFYGYSASAVLTCRCQSKSDGPLEIIEAADNVQASHMEDLT